MSEDKRETDTNAVDHAAQTKAAGDSAAGESDDTSAGAGAGNGDGGDAFDAIAAAAELDEILAGPEPEPARETDKHGESYTEILEAEIDALNAALEAKETELAERDARIRELEEDSNKARDRLGRDADAQHKRKARKILAEFVEVADDLERAINSARTETDHSPTVIYGMQLVQKRLMTAFAACGVSHRPAKGEPFDPAIHEAMSITAATKPEEDGACMYVIREGYMMGEEVLRPAGVIVGKLEQAEAASEPDPEAEPEP